MFMDPEQFKQFMDPSQYGKQFCEQMEKTFIERINEMVQSPAFLSSLGKGIEGTLDSKKTFDEAAKNYLQTMNMPTRDDIAKIMQYLQKIESRVIEVEEKIEELADDLSKIKKLHTPAGSTRRAKK